MQRARRRDSAAAARFLHAVSDLFCTRHSRSRFSGRHNRARRQSHVRRTWSRHAENFCTVHARDTRNLGGWFAASDHHPCLIPVTFRAWISRRHVSRETRKIAEATFWAARSLGRAQSGENPLDPDSEEPAKHTLFRSSR